MADVPTAFNRLDAVETQIKSLEERMDQIDNVLRQVRNDMLHLQGLRD